MSYTLKTDNYEDQLDDADLANILVDEVPDDDYVFPQDEIDCLITGGIGSDHNNNANEPMRPASNLEIEEEEGSAGGEEEDEYCMGELDNVINQI